MLGRVVLLAVTRVGRDRPLDEELAIVTQITGLSPYEARLRLVSPPPVLLGRNLSPADAHAFLSLLRGRGHGAVIVDETSLPDPERTLEPLEVELRPGALAGTDRKGQRYEVQLAEVLALLRAVEVVEEARTTEKVDRTLALGRAVLTGGLMRSKEVRASATEVRTDAERTLYVFRRTSADPIVLRERTVRYAGMGEHRGRTEYESFDRLVAWLKQGTPSAIHDDRLCANKRRTTLQAVSGTAKEYVALSTAAQETALAAFVLVHAHLQGQL
jgi:hypothetical protein